MSDTPSQPLPSGIGRNDKLEIQAGADILLNPGNGGFALWVRRDEGQPRAAVRLRSKDLPIEECVVLLAAMQIGLGKLCMTMAQQFGMDEEAFAAMCDKALEILGPEMDARTESFAPLVQDDQPLPRSAPRTEKGQQWILTSSKSAPSPIASPPRSPASLSRSPTPRRRC